MHIVHTMARSARHVSRSLCAPFGRQAHLRCERVDERAPAVGATATATGRVASRPSRDHARRRDRWRPAAAGRAISLPARAVVRKLSSRRRAGRRGITLVDGYGVRADGGAAAGVGHVAWQERVVKPPCTRTGSNTKNERNCSPACSAIAHAMVARSVCVALPPMTFATAISSSELPAATSSAAEGRPSICTSSILLAQQRQQFFGRDAGIWGVPPLLGGERVGRRGCGVESRACHGAGGGPSTDWAL